MPDRVPSDRSPPDPLAPDPLAPDPVPLGRAAARLGNVPVPAPLRGGTIAIGNFDGVHRGHAAVLDAALADARERGAPALVLTFEPHPRELFSGAPVFRLTAPEEKALVLGLRGFEAVVERRFDHAFAALPAETFVERVLVRDLGAAHVVIGDDFRFGARRAGDADTLRAALPTTVVRAVRADGEPYSSSRIRAALAAGRAEEAA